MRNYLVTLMPWSLLPPATIYRGNKKYDFYADETKIPEIIKDKLAEVKKDGTVVFKKKGETVKTSAELKKEGKPDKKPNPGKLK